MHATRVERRHNRRKFRASRPLHLQRVGAVGRDDVEAKALTRLLLAHGHGADEQVDRALHRPVGAPLFVVVELAALEAEKEALPAGRLQLGALRQKRQRALSVNLRQAVLVRTKKGQDAERSRCCRHAAIAHDSASDASLVLV
eukprot:1574670-Pleurochrysis_carterae.AAC.3